MQDIPLDCTYGTIQNHPIVTIWTSNVLGHQYFHLNGSYPSGCSLLSAYCQTLSGGHCESRLTGIDHATSRSVENLKDFAAYLVAKYEDKTPIDSSLLDESSQAWELRRFALGRQGYFALVPDGAQKGDTIAVIDGAKTPFILRREGNHHHLFGECYVHGFMNGEAMEKVAQGELREDKFHIR